MSAFSRIVRRAVAICAILLLVSLHAAIAIAADSPGPLTIRLIKLPANTPQGATIYLSGDFNSWNPTDERYRLTPDPQGQYGITLPAAVHDLGRFTLTLEQEPGPGDADANWQYLVTETETGTIYVAVQFWRDRTVQVTRGTASPSTATGAPAQGGLFENNVIPFLALAIVLTIPVIIYFRHRRRKEQILLSATEASSLAEYGAKRKHLLDAVATLRSNSKELERWSRAVKR